MSTRPIRTRNPSLRDIVWLMAQRFRGNAVDGPLCRRCGYAIVGIQSVNCPECGSDLTKRGVVDPSAIRRWPILTAVLFVWTVGFLIIVASGRRPVEAWFFPVLEVPDQLQAKFESQSGAYSIVGIHARSRIDWSNRSGKPPRVQSVMVYLGHLDSSYPGEPVLYIDPQRMAFEDQKHPHGFVSVHARVPRDPRERFDQWWTDRGLDLSDAAVAAEANEVWFMLQQARLLDMGTYQQFLEPPPTQYLRWIGGRSGLARIEAPRWATPLLVIASVVLWLTGVAAITFLVRFRKRDRTESPL